MDRDKENKVKQANGIEKETLAVTPLTSSLFTPSSSLSRNNGADGVGPILPLPPCSSPSKLSAGKSPSQAQQSVSLGRSTAVNLVIVVTNLLDYRLPPRQNSLGELKIPARISQTQIGLKMVQEFASNMERTSKVLVVEVQALLDTHVQLPTFSSTTTVSRKITSVLSSNYQDLKAV